MSESSSTPLPISGSPSGEDGDSYDLTDDLDLGFDGAEDILRSWRRGMRPDPDMTVSEWADQHRKLSSRASAEPGQYRTARTPYLREIMDALSPRHPAQRIRFMKAAQVGRLRQATTGSVSSSIMRWDRCWSSADGGDGQAHVARAAGSADRRKPRRARTDQPGPVAGCRHFDAVQGVSRRHLGADRGELGYWPELDAGRYIFLDEVDAYPASADEEGDPVTLAGLDRLVQARVKNEMP